MNNEMVRSDCLPIPCALSQVYCTCHHRAAIGKSADIQQVHYFLLRSVWHVLVARPLFKPRVSHTCLMWYQQHLAGCVASTLNQSALRAHMQKMELAVGIAAERLQAPH